MIGQASSSGADCLMPVLFVGHGNPMYALADNKFTSEWSNLGASIPRPKAVLVISAHWETNGTYVTAMERPRTIHDFYGFPRELFDVQYPAPGSPDLAQTIVDSIKCTNILLDHSEWGLDHGTWSVLKHIYPDADIPVLQFSLDRKLSPIKRYQLAKELQFLRDNGVLMIGSGNIVHNLGLIDFRNSSGYDWAASANEKLKELVMTGDHKSLTNYLELGEDVRKAVPTPEHFLPLIYFIGLLTGEDKVEIFNDVVELGSIAMTSFRT